MESKLPKNWVETELDSLFSLTYGKGLSVKELIPNGEYNVYGANSIIGKYKAFNQKKSKVIISCRGAASGAIHKTIPESFVTSNSIVLNAYSDELLLLDYVKYFMTSADKSEVITGTAQPQITIQLLKNLNFCFPPLAEQQRIVAKLDTLFGSLDALKIRLNNIPQLIKNFKQAVLTQAVTGKLTQEWRVGKELEYASLLNKNNQVEFEIINFDFLPNNWLKTALGNYANCSRGKFSVRPRNDPRYFDGNYPFMQIGDLPREGGYTSDYSKTLNEEGIKVSKSFPKGTVVVAIVGATIGLTGILEKEMFFPDSLIGLNCENFISNQYLEYYLRLCKNGFREISYARRWAAKY
ncbi:restriction endonuclease subunit S [Tenacibaculum finnmarkense]|nr:restriction endonuclease subunit S [Tenacibaculum finnmarkense]